MDGGKLEYIFYRYLCNTDKIDSILLSCPMYKYNYNNYTWYIDAAYEHWTASVYMYKAFFFSTFNLNSFEHQKQIYKL